VISPSSLRVLIITPSTVIVVPSSPSHMVMVTRLAQHGPLANESLTWKWNRLTAPKFRSQNP
jgi:hypothetical protein